MTAQKLKVLLKEKLRARGASRSGYSLLSVLFGPSVALRPLHKPWLLNRVVMSLVCESQIVGEDALSLDVSLGFCYQVLLNGVNVEDKDRTVQEPLLIAVLGLLGNMSSRSQGRNNHTFCAECAACRNVAQVAMVFIASLKRNSS